MANHQRALLTALVFAAIAGCDQKTVADSKSEPVVATVAASLPNPVVERVRTTPREPCTTPSGGLRLSSDTVAEMRFAATFAEVQARCPSAHEVTGDLGGYQVLAIALPFAGGELIAISGVDGYSGGSAGPIPPQDTVESWQAHGDSLRFADGSLIPRSLGGLRAAGFDGVIRFETGDDTEGTYVTPCRYPRMSLILGYIDVPRDSGTAHLDEGLLPDTTSIRTVSVLPASAGVDPALRILCRKPPVT